MATDKNAYFLRKTLPRFPAFSEDMDCDVAIIGGGITGITTAYLAKQAGLRAVLIERDRCAHADTGHTSAHLTYVTDTRINELVARFGKDHAQAVWDAGLAAIHEIAEIVRRLAIDCQFRWVPGFLHVDWLGEREKAEESLQKDVQLAKEFGFDAEFCQRVPFVGKPGARFANQAKFHPVLYLGSLLEKLSASGCPVFERSEVTEFEEKPLSLHVNGKKLHCRDIIIATHVPLQGNLATPAATLFQTKLASYSSYVIGAKISKGTVAEALYWDTSSPYRYLRVDAQHDCDYLIFGGEDHKTGQHANSEKCHDNLEHLLCAVAPPAKPDTRWTGQVVETHDGIPYIGKIAEHQYLATGFAGNGMTFGTLAAMMMIDSLTGRENPWKDLFDPHRKKLSSLWSYVKENLDYPYYFLKDKLGKAEGESLESVGPGEGRILQLDGRRVAVYRDGSGTITKLSPTCTHMGCIVRWNSADSTWDCPCHGSRFRATGEVIAGPAEKSLEPAETKD